MKIYGLSQNQIDRLIHDARQLELDQKEQYPDFADIFAIADRIINRKTVRLGWGGKRQPMTLNDFWDKTTERGKRNHKIAAQLGYDSTKPIIEVAKDNKVTFSTVVRVKDTVALMQTARLSGQALPKHPAPIRSKKKQAA